MVVPRNAILLGGRTIFVRTREKLSCGLPLVLKVEQSKSQTAQMWDGSKYALLIGAILNHTRDVYEAHLAEQTSIEIAEV